MRLQHLRAIVAAGMCAMAVATPSARRQAPTEQTATPANQPPTLTIRFEGGNVGKNAARVLDQLRQAGVLPTHDARLEAGKSVCDLYRTQLDFPTACTESLIKLAEKLNDAGYSHGKLKVGSSIVVPDVQFSSFQFSRRFDPKVPSDMKALADLEANWKTHVAEREKLPTGDLKISLTGWELKLPLTQESDVDRVMRELSSAHLANVTFTHPYSQRKLSRYESVLSPSQYRAACEAGAIQPGAQCAYPLLVGLNKLDVPACNVKCPDVFLVDQPVRRDPALGAVRDGLIDDDKPGPNVLAACRLPPLERRDHGTHLASIIVGAGPACVGVHPDAHIHSWNRDTDMAQMQDDIETAQAQHDEHPTSVGLPIFILASPWGYENKNGQTGAVLDSEKERQTNPLAGAIRNDGALWVVAAGQPDLTKPGEKQVEITPMLALGPMNFGEERSVLVVTACLDCGSSHPHLRPTSNYSSSLVHVAAPGDDMPGLAGLHRLAIGGGTSQAAAFVGAVASALVSRWPDSYGKPEFVKTRLQYTSRPVLQETEWVATGVIDPSIALLDPGSEYFQERGINEMRPVSLAGWCTDALTLVNPDTGKPLPNGQIRTRDLYRLYRINRDEDGRARWIAYTKVPFDTKPGVVLRVGPGVLTAASARVAKKKITGANSVLTASSFDDLLVPAPTLTPVVGGCQ